jgi:predicted nucleic acid-binding Zn ribbon protein
MLKIRCSDCAGDFIWTDDMPPRGNCPKPGCDGRYDVHEALRQNLAARSPIPAEALLCPACGGAILSRWTLCSGCGRVVAGRRSFRKRDLIFMTAIALLLLTLILRLLIRL